MSRQRGFTLLEVLAALVVFGFVMIGLLQGTRFGLAAWGMQSRDNAAQADLDAVDRTLRRLIEGMDPGNERAPPHIQGTEHTLSFVGAFPSGNMQEAPIDATLRLDAGHRLVFTWSPHLDVRWNAAPPAPRMAVLETGVARFDLSYWGGAGWQRDWTEPALPNLVRVHIALLGKPAHDWPDIVVMPRRERPDE